MIEKQYVVFKLGEEEYGLDIMNVSEIILYQETVKLPNVPSFIDGIINYRGSVIPIICLKKRFNIELKDNDHNTRIIIININDNQVGFIVDEASQTIKIDDNDVDPAPDIVSGIDIKFITGVGKINDRLVLLVDLEKVLTDEERKEIHQMNV
ncbi:chemotaxis protein, CheW-like protein [Gottschalkia acidurici 9a]|uniref:Chemotaxis protein, CheW-like protein n=1 Tax=Gottschalkia acidurici (strain ATCC 7906 / DSM 604 / BCRC 14475 / CIP 104303 / KCTC 5404 / NCIMB 10678 / 9a) TaxID=1128398 RepID=K0AXT7_GOTA9|nr:chemotaxis protein CheW [Gottschalkia acidurici]AFS77999.1 chemotaxis protein, CheW-like protein [Gottschalkia acidurici 9a]